MLLWLSLCPLEKHRISTAGAVQPFIEVALSLRKTGYCSVPVAAASGDSKGHEGFPGVA